MTTTTLNKTQAISLLSLQSIATAVAVIGSSVDVSTKIGPAALLVHFGRRATTALTAAPIFRLEGNFKASGNGFWGTVIPPFTTANHLTAAESEAVSGTVSSGTNVIGVASTTNLAAADIVYIDNGTIANSEWGRVKSISSNASITIEDNLLNAQTGATIYDQAEIITIPFNLAAFASLRFVVDAYSGPTGQNIAVEAWLITADSAGS